MQHWSLLHSLWQRHCDPAYKNTAHTNDARNWRKEVQALYAMNISHPAALKFLTEQRPSAENFQAWLLQAEQSYITLGVESDDTATGDVFSPADLLFWEENGYVMLKGAISKQQCAHTAQGILDCLDAQIDNPASWYQPHPRKNGLMLQLSDHPRLNANRESPRIRKAYEQLYGHTAIYKTIDQVSFNPPETAQCKFRGSTLHWDVSLALPIPDQFQGLLYLTDCGAHDGAFHCVPGFHRHIGNWLDGLPPTQDPREIAPQQLTEIPVAGEAGDFIIWHQALPHCASPNHGMTPRMVQYLTYFQEDVEEQSEWK